MPTQLTARIRTRKKGAMHSKNSNLLKAILESKKQTGNKSIKLIPTPSVLAQNGFEQAKAARRIVRLSTVRALDVQGIYNKKTRAIIQKGIQGVTNTSLPSEKKIILAQMQKTLVGEKLLTLQEFASIIGAIMTIEMNNIEKVRKIKLR